MFAKTLSPMNPENNAMFHVAPAGANGSTRLRVCASSDLVDQGLGVRFEIGLDQPAFAIRSEGVVHAYLNPLCACPGGIGLASVSFGTMGGYIWCAPPRGPL